MRSTISVPDDTSVTGMVIDLVSKLLEIDPLKINKNTVVDLSDGLDVLQLTVQIRKGLKRSGICIDARALGTMIKGSVSISKVASVVRNSINAAMGKP